MCGIGTYLLGHSDADLLETAVIAAAGDSVYQGHLAPGVEYPALLRALLRHAGPHIKHGWLSISGAIANENALKAVLQKHAPADRLSFAPDCGLSQTARWAARQKLKNMVTGVQLVRKELGV